MLLPEGQASARANRLISTTCSTDNQKYPLGVILVELSCQLGIRQSAMRANWIPRLQKEESDSLTKSDYMHFSEKNRIPVNLDELPFVVLRDLSEVGEGYIAEREALKATEKKRRASEGDTDKKRKKKVSGTLRVKKPW